MTDIVSHKSIDEQEKTASETILEAQEKPNAVLIRTNKNLPKKTKISIKTRFNCRWNDEQNAFTCPFSHKLTLESHLKKDGILCNLMDTHDYFFNLSPNEQKAERLEQIKQMVQRKGLIQVQYLNDCIDTYNQDWKTKLKPKDFIGKTIEDLSSSVSSEKPKQLDHLKAVWSVYEVFEKQRNEVVELNEKQKELREGEPDISNYQNWPFVVLGLNYNMEVLLSYNGKILKWPVERISEARIKAVFGNKCAEWSKLRDAIIYRAHDQGMINDETPIKQGVHGINDKWILVSGKHAGVFNGSSFTELEYPIYEGKLIAFENTPWLDWEELKRGFANHNLPQIFEEVLTKVQSWNWYDPSMAVYATAFIFLSPFQLLMSWNAWIYLTGSKGTGKSSFFDYILSAIYGSLICKLDKSTAYATAQTIGNTGLIPVFDEFEKYKHIPDILELAKLFNKGGNKTSGTPGKNADIYWLHPMAWFGSIYLPRQLGQDAAQESRMVKLEVKKLKDDSPILEKIDDEAGKKIASQIIAAMICNWNSIEHKAKEINANRKDILKAVPGIEIRTVENFMYASALLNIIDPEENYTVPKWATRHLEDDSEKILNTILFSMTRVDNTPYSISEVLILSSNGCNEAFSTNLEQNGLKFTTRENVKYLAVRCHTVSRHLLKDTDFKDHDIQAPLSRMEGAIPSHPVKILGKQERCVLIPIDKVGIFSN